ncbi:A/G-specific adenine glycosylase [Granulicoccus sp. GXG6511]|uniref:A/G-specific adenine glycosylase n=1 Tax=Granulicoccus sp. GXG6511 TaxID=3381351 RepID=UPI003D7E5B3C
MPADPATCPDTASAVIETVSAWFEENARDLPWRRSDCSPWGVLVSEFMLQQTPVARVLEPWRRWLDRWPTPGALAAEPAGEAIRAWGRLGYPRRALRLHAAAVAIEERHEGEVPSDIADLLALPGVGDYTAAAVASFAFGQAHPVLDTNIRRVLARAFTGLQFPAPAPTAAERRLAAALVPAGGAATWAAGSMELGALICTAVNPTCGACPIAGHCAWFAAGRPAHDGPPRRGQAYAGTDRQVRGLLLQVLREAEQAVPAGRLETVWPEATQRERALAGLVADGLVVEVAEGYALPR